MRKEDDITPWAPSHSVPSALYSWFFRTPRTDGVKDNRMRIFSSLSIELEQILHKAGHDNPRATAEGKCIGEVQSLKQCTLIFNLECNL